MNKNPELDEQGHEYAFPDRILCSAIHFEDGVENHPHPPKNITSGFVVCGYRHCNCFAIASLIPELDMRGVQGFLTVRGNFVDRKEGAKIALEAGQIKQKTEILFSEDLY